MQNSVDVIIPSFRVSENNLLPLISLERPTDFLIKFIIIADNPTIKVPTSIKSLALDGKIDLIINEQNYGFSKTRNIGLNRSEANWILLLDDDIVARPDLLLVFCESIRKNSDVLGYIGITNFPEPINAVTKAFFLLTGGQYDVGRFKSEHIWFPTANIALNRKLLGKRRFFEHLKKAGEDIEFFSRNSFENNQKYISVPEATVIHPWWNNGGSQMKRMFNYGWGTSDIINTKYLKEFSYYTFPSTPETILLVILFALVSAPVIGELSWILPLLVIVLVTEFLTNLIKQIILDNHFSLGIAWQMFLHKNANECGYLAGCIYNKKPICITKRLDVGFNKKYPNPYRFNRWKIIKLTLLLSGLGCYLLLRDGF